MNSTDSILIMLIVAMLGGIVVLCILALVLRWIFLVPTRTKQNTEIVRLLKEINEKMAGK